MWHIGPKTQAKSVEDQTKSGAREAPFSCALHGAFSPTGAINLHAKNSLDQIKQASGDSRESGSTTEAVQSAHTYTVIHRPPRRTADSRGLSVPELRRLHAAGRWLVSRRWDLCHVTIAGHHLDPATFRAALRRAKSRIADCQRRAGMPGLYVEVIEAERSPHAHLIVAVNPEARRLLRKLPGSRAFASLDDGANTFLQADDVHDLDGLLGYLSMEKTAWAQRTTGGTRRKVERPKDQVLGDRVRLSRDLEAALLAAGTIKPHVRTYAKATKTARPAKARTKAISPMAAPPDTTSDTGETLNRVDIHTVGAAELPASKPASATNVIAFAPRRRARPQGPSRDELDRLALERRTDAADRGRCARRELAKRGQPNATIGEVREFLAAFDARSPVGRWEPWKLGLVPGYRPTSVLQAS